MAPWERCQRRGGGGVFYHAGGFHRCSQVSLVWTQESSNLALLVCVFMCLWKLQAKLLIVCHVQVTLFVPVGRFGLQFERSHWHKMKRFVRPKDKTVIRTEKAGHLLVEKLETFLGAFLFISLSMNQLIVGAVVKHSRWMNGCYNDKSSLWGSIKAWWVILQLRSNKVICDNYLSLLSLSF